MVSKARKAIMIGLFGGAFLTGAVCLGQAQLMPVNAQPPLPAAIARLPGQRAWCFRECACKARATGLTRAQRRCSITRPAS